MKGPAFEGVVENRRIRWIVTRSCSIAAVLILLMAACVGARYFTGERVGAVEVTAIAVKAKAAHEEMYIGWPKYFNYSPEKSSPPEAMRGAPEFTRGKPWFDFTYLGTDQDNPHVFALDISPAFPEDHQALLYFDADNDGEFSTAEKFAPVPEAGKEGVIAFEPVVAKVRIDDVIVERHLEFGVYTEQSTTSSLHLRIADYVDALLIVADETYPVRLIDNSKNGLFSDSRVSPMAPLADHVLLDLKHDGFEGRVGWDGDIWAVSEYLCFAERCLRFLPSHSGDSLNVEAAIIPTSLIEMPTSEFELLLTQDPSGFANYFTVRGPGKAAIPKGEYAVVSYACGSTDATGNTWSFQWHRYETPVFLKTRDRAVRFGPPFTVSLETFAKKVSDKDRNAISKITIRVTITGRAGERYNVTDFRKNGEIVVPRVEIFGTGEDKVAGGDAPGSNIEHMGFDWYVPATVRGTFVARPVVDYGPFEVVVEPLEIKLESQEKTR